MRNKNEFKMKPSYQANETILIAPVGFTKNYIDVKYIHSENDSSINDWLSFVPLLTSLFGTDAKEVAIILI